VGQRCRALEVLAVNDAFWAGRRVLLTGHTGFKGSWLALWLQSLGAELTGLALPPTGEPNLFTLARVGEGMHSVEGDIRDLGQVQRVVARARPEVVFHLAAQALVQDSYQQPVETYATNVMGTVHVLEAVRHCPGVKAVVNVTSDKCYENRGHVPPYREDDPLGGHDPYSNSKACAELVSNAYRLSFLAGQAVGLATARAGNVIGGGDWACNRLVPDLIAAFGRGESALVRNPRAVRPWQHVLEPLHGYLLLAQHLHAQPAPFSEAWNFGPSQQDAITVEALAQRLAELWGDRAAWHAQPVTGAVHEAALLTLDASKAQQRLDWRPRLPLQQALALTVDWARQRAAGLDARTLCLAQIRAYAPVIN
jgi:CDP-glucose 4,6-dehydratase